MDLRTKLAIIGLGVTVLMLLGVAVCCGVPDACARNGADQVLAPPTHRATRVQRNHGPRRALVAGDSVRDRAQRWRQAQAN